MIDPIGAAAGSAPASRWAWLDDRNRILLATAGIAALGMIVGGYALGNGLVRARAADRAVSVRGLAERDVTADLATWTITYVRTAGDLATAQANIEADTRAIYAYFSRLGFPANALAPASVNVNSGSNDGTPFVTITQRLQFRTTDVARAQKAVAQQFDLIRAGVNLAEGSNMAYRYTRLNDLKSAMVADATRDARKVAEQFAHDSGAGVGGIKSASQGYFEIQARDGESEGYGASDTPFKKVRVVTTIDYYLR